MHARNAFSFGHSISDVCLSLDCFRSTPSSGRGRHPRRTSQPDPKPKLVTLCVKLVKIGAKVVRHGRYVTFQLAEVAVPRVSSGTAAAIYHLSGRQRKSKVAPQNSRYVS